MESASSKIVEEWKGNIELHKFHDDLKQKRFSHFLTIQTAFFAIYGLLIKESFVQNVVGLPIIAAATTIAALIILRYIEGMDKRGRAYVDVIKSHLLILEERLNELDPENKVSTYTNQYAVLVKKNAEMIQKYQNVRGIGNNDRFKEYVTEKPAHLGEEKIIKLFKFLWLFLFACAIFLSLSKLYVLISI